MFSFCNTQSKPENVSIVDESQVEAQIEPQVEAQATYYDSLCCDEAPPSMRLSHKRPRSYTITSNEFETETPTKGFITRSKFSRSNKYPGQYSPVCQKVFRKHLASGSDAQESIGHLSFVDSYETGYQTTIGSLSPRIYPYQKG